MTRYEQGYMKKCAEYGLDGRWVYKAAYAVKAGADGDESKPKNESGDSGGSGGSDQGASSGKPGFWDNVSEKAKSGYNQAKDWTSKQYNAAKDWTASQVDAARAWTADNHQAGAGAIGGGAAGALALLLHEAMRKKKGPNDRKDYLKKILLGLAIGSGAGALGGHYHEQIANAGNAVGNYTSNLWNAIRGKK